MRPCLRSANPGHTDPPHDHVTWLNRATSAVREQYSEADIPSYFSYARQFTLCDNYFTDAPSSTPNHLMVIAADSPVVNNPHMLDSAQPPAALSNAVLAQTILEAAGLTWKNYGGYAFS